MGERNAGCELGNLKMTLNNEEVKAASFRSGMVEQRKHKPKGGRKKGV